MQCNISEDPKKRMQYCDDDTPAPKTEHTIQLDAVLVRHF